MRCPSCSHELVIRTDPKNTEYEYVEGIRKKEMAFDPEEAETARVQDSEVSEKLAGKYHRRNCSSLPNMYLRYNNSIVNWVTFLLELD